MIKSYIVHRKSKIEAMTTKQMKKAIYEIARDKAIGYCDGIELRGEKVVYVERRPKERDLWFCNLQNDGYHVVAMLKYLTDSEAEFVYNQLTKAA